LRTPDDGQRNCPKKVEFYSKNKFEKLVHLVGLVKRIFLGQKLGHIFLELLLLLALTGFCIFSLPMENTILRSAHVS
jgi:hypothetical protein